MVVSRSAERPALAGIFFTVFDTQSTLLTYRSQKTKSDSSGIAILVLHRRCSLPAYRQLVLVPHLLFFCWATASTPDQWLRRRSPARAPGSDNHQNPLHDGRRSGTALASSLRREISGMLRSIPRFRGGCGLLHFQR